MNRRALLAALLLATVSGCTIPRTGGMKSELARAGESENFTLRRLDTDAVLRSRSAIPLDLPAAFKSAAVPRMGMLSPGDRLSLSIIESTGMSVPSAINGRLDVETIQIDANGRLAVPYAGAVPVAGRSVEDTRQLIQSRLANKLYRPQVILRKVDQPGNTVSVMGAITKGGSFQLGPSMQRLSDLIGTAGVTATNPEQLHIELTRGALRGATTLEHVLRNPAENVALQPGDVVTVNRTQGFATVIGAATMPGRVELTRARFSILDALSSTRGLADMAADPSGVFLFASADHGTAPAVIYQIDIRDPEQVQLAKEYYLSDGDLIYVSTASFAQTRKVLDVISRSAGTVSSY